MTSVPAIGFEYRPSRVAERVLAAVTALAVAAVWLSAMPWWGCLAASIALGTAWTLEHRRWRRPSIRAAVWASDGSWMLQQASSAEMPAHLRSFRALAGCLWLRLEAAPRRPVSLFFAPDNSDADLRRRLRMRLAATRADDPDATA
jgi:toxin CptA